MAIAGDCIEKFLLNFKFLINYFFLASGALVVAFSTYRMFVIKYGCIILTDLQKLRFSTEGFKFGLDSMKIAVQPSNNVDA